jgi:AcrR family transcriptional regulator
MTVRADRESTQPPRGTRNEARWEEVLTAAAGVFGEKGYRAATLRDIASRLGMLKGSLYYYIDTKEDLLFEILKRSHLQGVEYVAETPAMRTALPAVRLASLIRKWMGSVESLPPLLNIAESDLHFLQGERRREIVLLRNRIAQVPQEIITAGVADGSFDAAVDPYVATATLFRILNSTQQWYRPGGTVGWSDVADWYVRLMLGGLQPGAVEAPAQKRAGGQKARQGPRRRATG